MSKKYLFAVILLTALFSLNLASAGYSYYYPPHSYGYSNYDDDYRKTSYSYDKEYYTNYYPWGREKIYLSTTRRTTIERDYNQYYGDYYYRPYPRAPLYKYSYPSYSNWRYKMPYNYYDRDYDNNFNAYTKSYYYEPRYETLAGYYNWKY